MGCNKHDVVAGGVFSNPLGDEGAPDSILELVIGHHVHHHAPEFWLSDTVVPFDHLDDSSEVVDLAVVGKGIEYTGEGRFKGGY